MVTLPDATPEDVAEQREAIVEEPPGLEGELPDDASEADVADQRVEVTLDEEDAP